MSGFLEIPPWVEENLERERFVEDQIQLGRYWSRLLQEFDDRLTMVFVGENAHAIAVEDGASYKVDLAGIVPGRWHVRRRNDPPVADSYMPVTGPDGGYREPDSRMVDEIRRRDMRSGQVDDALAAHRKDRERRERDLALRREGLRDNFAADYRAARRVPGETLDKRRFGAGGDKK